jgi:tripartite-type tricarboxylate transporter receptor subunit TctC
MAELIPVSGLVQAEGIIFGSMSAPFTTVEEMIEYSKANPGTVKIAVDSPNGISGALVQEFCGQAGIELKWITSDSNEGNISLISGEVDLSINTWSDAGAYVEAGDTRALVVLAEERLKAFPDIPCSADLGYSAKLGYYRVFTALKGTPQEAVDAFAAAVVKAASRPEWKAWLDSNSMSDEYVFTAEELAEVLNLTHEYGKKLANK